MTVKLYVLALLPLIALVSSQLVDPHIQNLIQKASKECAKSFNITHLKKVLNHPTPENGCFLNCIREKVTAPIKKSPSPIVKNMVVRCEKKIPKTADKCQDAYKMRACLLKDNPGLAQFTM